MAITKVKGKSKPWKVYYYEIAVDAGRRIRTRKARYFESRSHAVTFDHMKALEYESYEAGLSNIIPITFEKFVADMWESFFVHKAPSYQASERSRLKLLSELFGGMEMHHIRAAEIQAKLFGLEDSGLSSKSIGNVHGLLSLLFKQARLRQHVSENPMEMVPRPKVVPRREVVALSELELARVLKYEGEELDLILLFIHTGLRMGEMCRLRVERDADFAANVLHVRNIEGAETKNRKWRTMPLTEVARDILKSVRVGPVVKMTRWGLEKRLRAVGDAIGVKVNSHRLRHTFCSLNMANGVPEPVVQRWLGHGSATITKRYTHLLGHDQKWATLDVGRRTSEKVRAVND